MFRLAAYALAISIILGASVAEAASSRTGYARPNFRDLVHSLVGLGGHDIQEDEVIDHYAEALYCDVYRKSYTNDFEWIEIRQTLRDMIIKDRAHFRNMYEISSPVILERYDFDDESFPLHEDSLLENVGTMVMFHPSTFEEYCDRTVQSQLFPQYITLRLRTPVNLDRISLPKEAAVKLINRIEARENIARQIYVRFRVRLATAEGVHGGGIGRNARFYGYVESIEFFEDKDLKIFLGKAR